MRIAILSFVSMPILLQNRRSLLFVEAPRRWTAEARRAKIFENTSEAVMFCHDFRLTNMLVIMKHPSEDLTMTAILPASFDQNEKLDDQILLFPQADALHQPS
jgi:hypothetical protein